jgi:hypothetical protein
MTILVLHGYVNPHDQREAKTWGFFHNHEATLEARGWVFDHVKLDGSFAIPSAYEKAVLERWKPTRDLLIWERDIVPTMPSLLALEACPEVLCAQRYPLATIGLISLWRASEQRSVFVKDPDAKPHDAHRVGKPGTQGVDWRYTTNADTYANMWGLGLTRFRAEMMKCPPAWAMGKFDDLDSRMSAYFTKLRYHAHLHGPPCGHIHDINDYQRDSGLHFLSEADLPQEEVEVVRKAKLI